MAIPGFFKQNKPRGFNYVPRYYDPVKEEMEERRRSRETENTSSRATQSPEGGSAHEEQSDAVPQKRGTTVYRSRIMRGDMKNYFHRRTERVQKYTLIRIIVIALIMMLVIYLYLRF